MRPLLIRGGRVIDPGQGIDRVGDVLVAEGTIAYAGRVEEPAPNADIIDAGGMVVCPGFIDLHCHLREPGYEAKETIATGTKAAARGGFTTVCCMPNTSPPLDTEIQLQNVEAVAAISGLVRVLPIACITRGQKGAELTDFARLAGAGAIAFSDDGRPVTSSSVMRAALESARWVGRPVVDHCEDLALTARSHMNEGDLSRRLNIGGMPAAAEEIMVARDLALAELTGGHIHIAHVSTESSVDMIRRGKARGIKVTAEATPHHLTMTEEKVLSCGARAKVNPPLRTRTDVQAVVKGLRDGTIDAVATDEAPPTREDKGVDFAQAAFGISGFETAFGTLMALVQGGNVSLPHLIAALTWAPARIIHRPGLGTLKAGASGDVVVLDTNRDWVVDVNLFASKGKNSPLDGARLRGRVMVTVYQGKIVYQDDLMSLRHGGAATGNATGVGTT